MKSNKLIAEFMGYEKYTYRGYTMYVFGENNHRTNIDLHYHIDWNWLMEVIAKIESMGFVTEISGNIERSFALIGIANSNVSISRVGYGVEFMNKKDATYRAVIEFITWYNEQNKQKNYESN